MKLHPLVPLLLPFVWTYTGGLFLRPLTTALGSVNPDLSASAWQAVIFMGTATFSGWAIGQAVKGEPAQDITRRDWQAARERVAEEAREYQSVLRPGNLALGVANGKRTQVFHFPAGITLDHLTAFGDLIASGQPPRYRKLKDTFDHQLWSEFRDWLMIEEINKFAVMAAYTGGRDEWDVNRDGRKLAIIWRCQASPTGLLSSAKKVQIKGNKTINKQLDEESE